DNLYTGLDLGAVGKGYGCDKAIEIYSQNNVDDAVISVGGTIGLYSAEDKKEWTVAIKDPFEAMKGNYSTIGNIRLNKGYIATSGLYEKYFNEDDTIYHHILDPDTGYPVENELMSVTVVSQTGVLSEILSTACFVMGVENSKEVLKQYNAQAVFVLKDKNIYVTDGIFDNFEPAAHQYSIKKLEL
ncbi:MAG: FAD:protein FMN transferase, partial [Clostridia bacterium]|nr:FAD:protein FMN transferase [Clostridia bacterium]